MRLSGFVNSQEVVGWAGLWMRVDQGKDMVVLDNMEDRPIRAPQTGSGTTWYWIYLKMRPAFHLGFCWPVQERSG